MVVSAASKRFIVPAAAVLLLSSGTAASAAQAETQAEIPAETQTETQVETQAETQAETQTETQADSLPETLPKAVSINLCTDQLVMLLAEPSQILALSALSQDKAGSWFHERAGRYQKIEPVAEQVLPLAPDIVVTGPYTSRYTISLLDELDIKHETLPIANTMEQMLANVERVGELLSQQDKATTIIDDVNTRLALIADRVSQLDENDKPTIAVYEPNGYTVGNQTLRGQLMNLAGWHNVATTQNIETYGVLDLEQMIGLRPQALMESPYSEDTYSRGQMLTQHPAIRASGLNPKIIKVPSNQTICAGPWAVDLIEQLLSANTALQQPD